MKKFFLILSLFFIKNQANGQNLNSIELTEITVNGVHFFETKNVVLNSFGSPNEIQTIYDEYRGAEIEIYCYGNNEIIFFQNQFDSFLIQNDLFSFSSENISINMSIADVVTKLENVANSDIIIENSGEIKLYIKENDQLWDDYILFVFDDTEKLIAYYLSQQL